MKKKVMRIALFTMLFAATLVSIFAFSNTTEVSAASLVWADEFNGSSLDTSKWNYDIGNGNWGWGNGELQYYTNSTNNVSVHDGALHITARAENINGFGYSSGRINSAGKYDFKYGTVEARLAVPASTGIWPAFWMLGSNIGSVGWPACGETDIMEAVNAEYKVYGTNHWDSNGHASYGNGSANYDITQYHTYKMDWDQDYIRMYVDGAKYHEIAISNSTGGTEEFHRNFYFILNVAVGGQWPGYSVGAMPQTMKVDYVRVYQNTGSSSNNNNNNNNNTNTNTSTGAVVAYNNSNYGSNSASFGVGDYNLASLNAKGFANDSLSSIRVPFGYKVTLYEHDNFSGASKVLTGDSNWIGSDWNDRTSSIRVQMAQYRIVNRNSGLALDIANAGGNNQNGANLLQWNANGGAWQHWIFHNSGDDNSFYITSALNGKVIDVDAWSLDNGHNIHMWDNAGGNNQKWYVTYSDGYYFFINKHSNKCLEIDNWSTAAGANVQQWDYFAQTNQQFSLVLVN